MSRKPRSNSRNLKEMASSSGSAIELHMSTRISGGEMMASEYICWRSSGGRSEKVRTGRC